MMLKRRSQLVINSNLALAAAGILGTSQGIALPRVHPIEEIHITVSMTQDATGSTFSTSTSPQICDRLRGILKKATLFVQDGPEARQVVALSGAAMLEYSASVGLNLDRATLATMVLDGTPATTTVAANMQNRITYRIPLVHPMLGEPLRTRCLLPVHTLNTDPLLQLDFANATDFTAVNHFSAVLVEVRLIQRLMPDSVTQGIIAAGGFIPFDLVETGYSIGSNLSGEQYWDLPLGGQYMNLLIRSYANLASTTITRDTIDQVTTLGAESKWRLVSGQTTLEEFRMRDLQTQNDYSRVANSATQSSSPNFAGAVAANTSFQPASSVILDFLSDGLESANELGSLLDANIAANSGLKLQLTGFIVAPSGGQHTLFVVGHRLMGNLTPWQTLRFQ